MDVRARHTERPYVRVACELRVPFVPRLQLLHAVVHGIAVRARDDNGHLTLEAHLRLLRRPVACALECTDALQTAVPFPKKCAVPALETRERRRERRSGES
jgi:hypothetical protein